VDSIDRDSGGVLYFAQYGSRIVCDKVRGAVLMLRKVRSTTYNYRQYPAPYHKGHMGQLPVGSWYSSD